jgi:SPP1 gp7 family putative phage head morphogenesis protein
MTERAPRMPGKAPRKLEPTGIALEYGKALERFVGEAWRLVGKTVLPEIPRILAETRKGLRLDSGPRDVNALFDALSEAFFGALSNRRLFDLAKKFSDRTVKHQREEFRKQVTASLGIDVLGVEPNLKPLLEAFASENVALIKSLPNELFDRLEKATTRAVREGKRWEVLARELQRELGISESRARLIARDQVGKLTSNLDRVRQQEIGVEAYIWRSMNDSRVRPDHSRREGKRFLWSDPPADGHPGQAVMCRCYSEPDLSDIMKG